MPTSPVVHRAFSAGELAPALHARADLPRYVTGLALCRNFLIRREGGAWNRPGTRFVTAAKAGATAVRLFPFIFEAADQTYVIEAGPLYFRFLWHGAPVLVGSAPAWSGVTAYVVGDLVSSGGAIYYCILAHTNQVPPNATYWYPLPASGGSWMYEIPTPYAGADLPAIDYAQSADVLTLAHPSHAPRELRRLGPTTWTLVVVTTAPSLTPPTNPSGVAGAAGTRTFTYVVTAAKVATYEESLASSAITLAAAAEPTETAPHVLSCDVHAQAAEYYWYGDGGYGNGIYGFLGTSASNSFRDVGFAPDFTTTPPVPRTLFTATNNYPGAVCYYQQRRAFARTIAEPEHIWLSRVGAYANFSVSTPLQDDDAIEFVIASRELNPPAWLVPLKRLIVLSDAGEWIVRGDEEGVLRPTAINPDQEGYVGAALRLRPLTIGDAVLYVQPRGTVLRELRFTIEPGMLGGRELSLVARHLFDGLTLTRLAWHQEPHSTVWAVRSDGTLLACTYQRDEEIIAWSRHDTGAGGAFEDIVVVPDTTAGEDVAYVVVRRTILGATVRYIERFASRRIDLTDLARSAWFVDCGALYDGAPVSTVTGLAHLDGQIVAVVADGAVLFNGDPAHPQAEQYRVASGQIRLPVAASVVIVGLPIAFPELELLDLDVEGSDVRARQKRVQGVTLQLETSHRNLLAGPDADHLGRVGPPVAGSANVVTAEPAPVEVHGFGRWGSRGRVRLRVTEPLPVHITAVIPHVELGG